MTQIVKHTFEGKAKDLKFAHIPTNGGIISVKIDGVEFEVRMLDGNNPACRTYMARKAPALNFAVWDYHVGLLHGLRYQLTYAARIHNEYKARREALLKSQGINLQ